MNDLVERLREWSIVTCREAADEIERLRAQTPTETADEIKYLRARLQAAEAQLVNQAGIMHRFGDKPDATG